MPLIDMPLSELERYPGRNPRPDDFDDYWARGLAELDDVDTQLERRPAAFSLPGVRCENLYFTGVGGARVHAKYLAPAGADQPGPAVLHFHGYTGSAGDWAAHLGHVAAGFRVAALDCRGQGGSSEDTAAVRGTTHQGHIIRGLDDHPDNLYYRRVFLDAAQLARIVAGFDEVDADRMASQGGSQGGALALVCAALEPRIRRVVTAYPFLCDYRRTWEMDQGGSAYAELRQFFRHHDPRHERADDIFSRLGYIDVQHLAPRVRGDVLMATGLMDTTCLPSTQFAAYNKITAPKEVVVYPDFGHEGLPGWNDRGLSFLLEGLG